MIPKLEEARNLLVRRWGEMGGYWGINRTMAEIHALLFVTRDSLCTDDIMDQLKISRGNASMNLRGLVDWGLAERVHRLGDRKEYFRSDPDVWRMFETIMRERRRREVEPIIATIDRCCDLAREAEAAREGPALEDIREFHRRLEALRTFLSGMGKLFEMLLQFGPQGMESLTGMLPTVAGRDAATAKANRGRTRRTANRRGTPRPRSNGAGGWQPPRSAGVSAARRASDAVGPPALPRP